MASKAAASASAFTAKGFCARRRSSASPSDANRHPIRSAASPNAFENVRLTAKFGYFRIQGKTVSPEKSKYASSTSTSVRGAASRTAAKSFFGSIVPVGLLGFARASQRRAALLVFRIARERLRHERSAQGAGNFGRAAHGVLVEIEPELSRPPFHGRPIFFQEPYGLTRSEHRRCTSFR